MFLGPRCQKFWSGGPTVAPGDLSFKQSPGDVKAQSGLETTALDSMEPAFSSPNPFTPSHAAYCLGSHVEVGLLQTPLYLGRDCTEKSKGPGVKEQAPNPGHAT